MTGVSKTLFIPLYGKAKVSRQGIIIKDSMAEKIWESCTFEVHGKSKSKWLTYNMAMRAKIFDDWVEKMLTQNPDALVLHIGCGLDSRAFRIEAPYNSWIDGDFPEVLEERKKYYSENEHYKMIAFDASKSEMVEKLSDAKIVIVVFEGISMYLRNEELNSFVRALDKKYPQVHMLLDVYTVFGAKASKYKNPINDVGVTTVWGLDDINVVLEGTQFKCDAEHSLTPKNLVNQLPPFDRRFFKFLFTGCFYRKIYRLYEISKTL
ncbi:MAG: class I SAM-dependent methyltransferase [Treponema sp.]|nr:class I SAM-dependent methyltransferase [Treponema sp.]